MPHTITSSALVAMEDRSKIDIQKCWVQSKGKRKIEFIYFCGKLYVINENVLNKYYIQWNVWESLRGRGSFDKYTTTRRENIFGFWLECQWNWTNTIKSNQNHQATKMNRRQSVASLSSAVFHLHNACTHTTMLIECMCAHQMNREIWHLPSCNERV